MVSLVFVSRTIFRCFIPSTRCNTRITRPALLFLSSFFLFPPFRQILTRDEILLKRVIKVQRTSGSIINLGNWKNPPTISSSSKYYLTLFQPRNVERRCACLISTLSWKLTKSLPRPDRLTLEIVEKRGMRRMEG